MPLLFEMDWDLETVEKRKEVGNEEQPKPVKVAPNKVKQEMHKDEKNKNTKKFRKRWSKKRSPSSRDEVVLMFLNKKKKKWGFSVHPIHRRQQEKKQSPPKLSKVWNKPKM